MSKTQLIAMSIPWALLLMLCLANLARVIQVRMVREWFFVNDYAAYRRLPSFDAMVSRNWNIWTLEQWKQYVKGQKC